MEGSDFIGGLGKAQGNDNLWQKELQTICWRCLWCAILRTSVPNGQPPTRDFFLIHEFLCADPQILYHVPPSSKLHLDSLPAIRRMRETLWWVYVMPQDPPFSSQWYSPRVLASQSRNIPRALGGWAVVVFATPSSPKLFRQWTLVLLLQNILYRTLLGHCPGRLLKIVLSALPTSVSCGNAYLFSWWSSRKKEINTVLTVL